MFNPNMPKPLQAKIEVRIPESELRIDFARSGGKGGQNVNKRSTKAQIRWNIGASKSFSEEEKERIRRELLNRINKMDELVIESQEERTQEDNKRLGIERLNRLVESALYTEAERIPTRPTYGSKERRIEEKKKQGEKKKMREKFRV